MANTLTSAIDSLRKPADYAGAGFIPDDTQQIDDYSNFALAQADAESLAAMR